MDGISGQTSGVEGGDGEDAGDDDPMRKQPTGCSPSTSSKSNVSRGLSSLSMGVCSQASVNAEKEIEFAVRASLMLGGNSAAPPRWNVSELRKEAELLEQKAAKKKLIECALVSFMTEGDGVGFRKACMRRCAIIKVDIARSL